jgi:hypothetical protein
LEVETIEYENRLQARRSAWFLPRVRVRARDRVRDRNRVRVMMKVEVNVKI